MTGLFGRKRKPSTSTQAIKQAVSDNSGSAKPTAGLTSNSNVMTANARLGDAERQTTVTVTTDQTTATTDATLSERSSRSNSYSPASFYGSAHTLPPRSRADTGATDTSNVSRPTRSPDSMATSDTGSSLRSEGSSPAVTPPTSCSDTLASPPSGSCDLLHQNATVASSSPDRQALTSSLDSRPRLLSLSDSGAMQSSTGLDLSIPPSNANRPPYTPPIQVRRLTNNSLILPNLPRASPPMAPASLPVVSNDEAPLAEEVTNATATNATAAGTATERRMRSLPRLLSNDAYSLPTSGANGMPATLPEQDGESESDTEDAGTSEGQDDDDDESTGEDSTEDDHDQEEATAAIRSAPIRVTPGASPQLASSAPINGRSGALPQSWVTFAPVTPTPGPSRLARPSTGDNSQPSDSYFDIRRPTTGVASSRTPGQPLLTPLIPQSYSNTARGRRPMHQDEVDAPRPAPSSPVRGSAEDEAHHGLSSAHYRHRSQSAIALTSPGLPQDSTRAASAAQTLDPVWQNVEGPITPGPSFLKSPVTPMQPSTQTSTPRQSPPPTTPSQNGHKLERRRSMYELPTAPPEYSAVYSRSGQQQLVFPREEEGAECLPSYTCAIHFEGYLPRKMEFTSPGVQAKDRSWKRSYMVLHGTSIKFYKYDLKTHPIPGEEDWSSLTVAMAGRDGPPPLHFHPGDYMAEEQANASHKFPTSIGDARAKAKSKIVQATTASDTNMLIRHYSLQNAESGLAADYIKRKHVVRVRAEGEQFLLQTNGDRGTIDLIEVLQAATNVSLDLDCRPLPKFITLPRRRRRRRRIDPNAATASGAGTNGANTAGQPANGTERHEEDRMGDMLAEEQQAYSASAAGASTV
ncbi:hypothetical protein OIO90_002113 [Microbotryomycetes sp. JL221]|nr:hypothetical protein OIO90_002113 [Microbotryomycetes sp. JL221]